MEMRQSLPVRWRDSAVWPRRTSARAAEARCEESFVERAACEGLRGEGEGCGGDAEGAGETDAVDADGAERGEVEAEAREGGEGFGGEEVAADFVVRGEGALEEGDAAAGEGELNGGGGAGGAAAEDDRVEIARGAHRMRATQRRFIGCCSMFAPETLACVSMRCQSSGTKARRRETGPS